MEFLSATCAHLPCPCRCGTALTVDLITTVRPWWMLEFDDRGRMTINPSLDVPACGSHFWLIGGRVQWVDDFASGRRFS